MNINEIFRKLAVKVSAAAGKPWTFALAILLVAVWAITGPLFNFSNTWQLAINTFTTISTFLMVFLIQNTQNRDSRAIQLKLDELLKGIRGARDSLVDLEDMPDEVIEKLTKESQALGRKNLKEFSDKK